MEVGALSFLSVEGVCKGEWVGFLFLEGLRLKLKKTR